MTIEVELINGVCLGAEYYNDEYFGKVVIVDLLFFCLLVQWGDN